MQFEWDEAKRRRLIEQRQVDILYAALIFEGSILTVHDSRRDYGEVRMISIGMVEMNASSSSTPRETGLLGSSQLGRQAVGPMSATRKASLHDIRQMKARGQLFHDPNAPTDPEELGPDFWARAQLEPAGVPRSVHLKLDPEVFAFFKNQGKGHLTRMQDVLKAYVRAKSRR